MCSFIILAGDHIPQNLKKSFFNSAKKISFRGPDETVNLSFQKHLVSFSRLSINSLENGSQPVFSEDKDFLICFNGEIFNYKNLIEDLKKQDIKFVRESEADLILKLYQLYSEKCVDYLRGMFSFAIINFKENLIFAAVDKFSMKPLYYYKDDRFLLIGSNLEPFLENKIIKRVFNHDIINQFICFGRLFNEQTFDKNIFKLMPAHLLKIKNNGIFKKQYWDLKLNEEIRPTNLGILREKTYKCFSSSINKWKLSEVPLSITRSSGVDSNILYKFLTFGGEDIFSYSIPETSEERVINNEKKVFVDEKEVLKHLRNFYKTSPKPLANSSSLSFFSLYSNIKQDKIKVSFTGEGMDELSGGYPRHSKQLENSKNSDFLQSFTKTYLPTIQSYSYFSKNRRFEEIIENLEKEILSIKLNSKEIRSKILEFDQRTLIPTLAERHDLIGMFFSLEIRPAFLDDELVSFINENIPMDLKFNTTQNKIFLKSLLNELGLGELAKIEKMGTPSVFQRILSDKKEMSKFKKIFANSIVKEFIDEEKFLNCLEELNKNQGTTNILYNEIVVWRIFSLTLWLNQKNLV